MPHQEYEDHDRQAKCCEVRERDRGHQVQGSDQRAQQQRQDDPDGQQDEGEHDQRIPVAG